MLHHHFSTRFVAYTCAQGQLTSTQLAWHEPVMPWSLISAISLCQTQMKTLVQDTSAVA